MNDAIPSVPHAAVIGSGFGGLAAAIRLLASGFKVTVFEARDKPGGRAYVYENQGFIFDGGPTVITAPHCIEELYDVAGQRMQDAIELLPVEPLYRLLWDDGDRFEYVGDGAQFAEQVRQKSPQDYEGYLQFCDYAQKVFAAAYENLVAQPFLSFADMIRVAPDLIRLRADRSVYRTVERLIKNDHLRQALSFHTLLVGGNPCTTSSIYTLIHHLERKWGVFFPRGGTGALVRALAQLIGDLGGDLRLSAKVSQIEIGQRSGRTVHHVHTEKHGAETFDLVISNADVHHTYDHLYRSVPSAKATTKRLEQRDWSMSLFVLYFGTDRNYDDLAHHTILFASRYRELLSEIFSGSELPHDFSLYLHAPCVTDASMAPPGCGAYYVLSPVPHLGHAKINWSHYGERYADKIILALERHMPDLRKHIVVKSWLTPEGFKNELAAFNGSAFSLSPTLTQSAWFRPHNRDPKIPGLYIVGAGTHPGAGMPGVINSAKATAGVIQKDFAR